MIDLDIAPRYAVLRDDDVQRIHSQALRTLERVGVTLDYAPAVEVFVRNGAAADLSTGRVRIPHGLVAERLHLAPSAFSVCGQSQERDLVVSVGGPRLTRPATGLNWILDAGARVRRAVDADDVVHWTRVSQALSNLDFCSTVFDQVGAPSSMEVRAVAAMLPHTDRPLMVSGLSGEGIRYVRRLCEVAQGTDRGPRAMVLTSVNSPLVYARGQAEVALAAAEEGIPVVCNSSPVGGVTAPVTLAGQLALMHAEILAAVMLVELHRPGAPVLYAPYPSVLDMKSGWVAYGSPATGLLTAAGVQLGRACGLPTSSSGLMTDACTPDPLAASEKWSSGFPPFAAGASLNGGAGALATQGTISLEQLVVDDAIFGQMRRHSQGVVVDDDTLAADPIQEVGPGGSFLETEHTRAFMRREYWYSPLANRLGAAAWEAAGCRDANDRARAEVEAILSRPSIFLSEEQQDELVRLRDRAQVELGESPAPGRTKPPAGVARESSWM